jgi:hypothetical protein
VRKGGLLEEVRASKMAGREIVARLALKASSQVAGRQDLVCGIQSILFEHCVLSTSQRYRVYRVYTGKITGVSYSDTRKRVQADLD